MMGLSWECEPALQQIAARYGDTVELDDRMGVLVRGVVDAAMLIRAVEAVGGKTAR